MGSTKVCATVCIPRVLFEAVVSIVGITLDNNARPMVEATASATMLIRTKAVIFVASTPPIS